MSWFGDALKVVFGLDDGMRAWRDRVAAAERHLHWGIESRQQRDFERVLHMLSECRDEEQPSAHYRYRRERAAAESYLWLARLVLERVAEQFGKIDEYFDGVEEGRRSLGAQVEAARERVKQLEADGSLISAREERRRFEDLERESRDLPDISGEKGKRRSAVLAKLGPLFEKHRDNAAQRLAAVRAVNGLGAEDSADRDDVAKRQTAGLSSLEAGWKELTAGGPGAAAPGNSRSGASADKSVAHKGPPVTKATG